MGLIYWLAGRTDLNDLPAETFNQWTVLRLRIRDDHIIIRYKECICDLPFGSKRFAGTRCAKDQAIRVFQLLPVYHDQVVGKGIQPIIQRLVTCLEQLLRCERHKDCRTAGGHPSLDPDQVICKRQRTHQPLFLLEIKPRQVAVMLLCNGICLEYIVLQLLLRVAGI